ncbi:FG-GAP repeat protein [Bradyrhizobium lablabi]|uniref:FG-GAP-like repeat-containing protein n=1 Tax=Bradyrhizobium lablabi TaxID=722472 RepID=UPI001BA57D06|nr:FG-GAP-like repeat-containing protein [Bradyrhizobium lablabi]MBR1125274.1 FG-GAP repeat protein [Bradyrhizobium lablabi]
MPLNLTFINAGNYTIDDNGIPGDNTSVIRDGNGNVVYTFVHPGDSIGLTVGAPGVHLTVNLTDGLGAANLTIGSLTSAAASPDSITIGSVRTTGIVTLVANGAITELGSDAGADIIAGQVILSANTGVGTAGNAIETQTPTIEAETTTGGITLSNVGSVQIGGISDNVNGLEVATSGDINFSNVGTIVLSDSTGTASVRGGTTSGNVTLTASGGDADIIAGVNNDAISVPGGYLILQAGRDVAFGIIGTDFDNDVRARGSILINAGRDFLIDGFADLASDDFAADTGGNVTITTGRNIHVRNAAGADGSIFANGSSGADVVLTTGANGALIVDPASIGSSQPIASNSGDVIVNADRILIDSASGIGAPNGQVTLRPVTAGREIWLGSIPDASVALELSSAELSRIFSPNLTIGADNAGSINVLSSIASLPANATLRTGENILIGASLTNATALALRAGNNIYHTAGTITTGTLTALVDALGNDAATGGVAWFNAAVAAAPITIDGGGENDTLTGIEGVEQTVHGNGGNDRIVSSGEGHYFGDAGNDVMLAGLSSGLVPEVLDGGSGIDTLDLTSFNGGYTVNLATGVTNFAFESFINMENVVAGTGNDSLVGSAVANQISGGDGNDTINGGGAADTLSGGAGTDTVAFSGNRADYLVGYNSNTQTFTFRDLRNGSPDGTDRVTGVEVFAFADGLFPSGTFEHAVPLKDFNGDGNSDILWRNDAGAAQIWNMDGGTLLGANSLGTIPTEWTIAGTGDFNGDGKSDLLWRNESTGVTQTWDMSNATILGTHSLGSIPLAWKVLDTGDFNGDGTSDILWRDDSTGATQIWNMLNGNVQTTQSLGVIPTVWKLEGTGDFNEDHKSDLLWRNESSGVTQIWNMDNGTTLGVQSLGVIPVNFKVEGIGDFNGDGKSDLLWRNDSTGVTQIWNMNNGTIQSTRALGTILANFQVEDVADYSGDHNADILWRNTTTSVTQIWEMDDGAITTAQSLGVVPNNWHVIA